MQHAGVIFVEIGRASCSVPLLQDRLGRNDVHVPHRIAETESEQLNLPGLADGIQEPVFDVWPSLDGWVCYRVYEPREVGGLVERVAEFLEVMTIKWLIPGSQVRSQKGAAADRYKSMEFLEGGRNRRLATGHRAT